MNKRSALAVFAAVTVLAACGHHPGHHGGGWPGAGGPRGAGPGYPTARASETPVVIVDETRGILVSPAYLSFEPNQKDFDIVWSLPADGKYRFLKEGGIVVEGEILDKVLRVPGDVTGKGLEKDDRVLLLDRKQQEIVGCTVSEDRLQAKCRNRHTRPGIFKYTLRVSNGEKTVVVDPPMINW